MSRRNPFNATKPAEWATMSKKSRKRWNKQHWRPEQYKCDLALKREKTRLERRAAGAGRGAGLEALAGRISKQNPQRNTVRLILQHPAMARAFDRAPESRKAQILAKLTAVADRARSIRRSNPGHRLSATARARKKANWYQSRTATERERRKLSWMSPADRRRIEREEMANPRRTRRTSR